VLAATRFPFGFDVSKANGAIVEPELSIVIPFCDVELYLEACLDSVAAQTFTSFEAVLVDDGSTDDSSNIAERFLQKDRRFRLVRQPNRGTGAARNTGLQEIRGKYIAFVDSDDIVADDAYEQLIGSLRETGSDIACGGVRRFDHEHVWASPLHEGIFDETRLRTHISRQADLLGDRTVWNKVYRRSFWVEHGITYPEHALEDASVAVPAHVLAEAVDVLKGPVYFWRQRDKGPLSTTQRIFELHILNGRMEQVQTVSTFLAKHDMSLKRAYDFVALQHDVLILLTALPHVDDVSRRKILDFSREFLEKAEDGVLSAVGAEEKEYYELLLQGQTSKLIQLLTQRPQESFL
jgi:CDP-glycerol glycerophosphotransferase